MLAVGGPWVMGANTNWAICDAAKAIPLYFLRTFSLEIGIDIFVQLCSELYWGGKDGYSY